jgi:serine/threonine protein kinase
VFEASPCKFPADVFSFGMVIYAVLTGLQPFPGMTAFKRMREIVDGGCPEFPSSAPKALVRLARKCFAADPQQQPTFSAIVDGRSIWAFREYRTRVTADRQLKADVGSAKRQGSAPKDGEVTRWPEAVN